MKKSTVPETAGSDSPFKDIDQSDISEDDNPDHSNSDMELSEASSPVTREGVIPEKQGIVVSPSKAVPGGEKASVPISSSKEVTNRKGNDNATRTPLALAPAMASASARTLWSLSQIETEDEILEASAASGMPHIEPEEDPEQDSQSDSSVRSERDTVNSPMEVVAKALHERLLSQSKARIANSAVGDAKSIKPSEIPSLALPGMEKGCSAAETKKPVPVPKKKRKPLGGRIMEGFGSGKASLEASIPTKKKRRILQRPVEEEEEEKEDHVAYENPAAVSKKRGKSSKRRIEDDEDADSDVPPSP
ncbi:hypothetical protein HKX48_003295, partial [Thoreauomyces humboldtii]